jgi:hypothetical protein
MFTDTDVIEHLSRRTLRLNGKADFKQVVKELVYATHHLNKHFKECPLPVGYAPENHPIIQLLVMKLTNISCPKRDVSYYQLENIVKDLAHLEA